MAAKKPPLTPAEMLLIELEKRNLSQRSLAEKLDVILTKMEETKLSVSQKEDKKDAKEESVKMNFSVEGYNVVRDWSKKWKY